MGKSFKNVIKKLPTNAKKTALSKIKEVEIGKVHIYTNRFKRHVADQ